MIVWNGLLSKALRTIVPHVDLRFYGVTIRWVGLGVIVRRRREMKPLPPAWSTALESLDHVNLEDLSWNSLRDLTDRLEDVQRRIRDAEADRRESWGQDV